MYRQANILFSLQNGIESTCVLIKQRGVIALLDSGRRDLSWDVLFTILHDTVYKEVDGGSYTKKLLASMIESVQNVVDKVSMVCH